jgi:predicted porin
MKKSLVALAALAATTAFAQSSVTLSGNIDAGYQSIDYKGGKSAGITNNGSSTSTIQFSGTEDLGGGLKANFKLNSDFNPTTTNGNSGGAAAHTASTGSWLNSEQRVGLSGGFGAIDMGVVNNGSLAAAGTGTPFGTAVGSGFRSLWTTDSLTVASSSPVRFDNAVRYTSPSMSGFTGEYYYVKKNANATNNTFGTTFGSYDTNGISEITLKYSNGPLNVAYASQTQDAVGTGTAPADNKGTLNTLGLNYTMGAVTGYLMNQTAKDNDATAADKLDRTTNIYGVKYVSGAHSFMVQTGNAKLKSSGQTSTATFAVEGEKSTVTGIGYDYALSKRTTAYFRSESINDKAGLVAARATIDVAGQTKITRQAIGVRHTF